MKHAGNEALDALEPLLERVRRKTELTERKRGIFYKGSKAFLHFHEDPSGLFADLWLGTEWARIRVTTRREQGAFLSRLKALRVNS